MYKERESTHLYTMPYPQDLGNLILISAMIYENKIVVETESNKSIQFPFLPIETLEKYTYN